MDKEQAGKLMRSYRERRGYTQKQVADLSSISSEQYLSALENGKYDVRKSEHFDSLIKLYGMSLDEVRKIAPERIIEVSNSVASPQADVVILDVTEFVRVPVRGLSAAGMAFYSDSNLIGHITLHKTEFDPAHTVIRVCGDSMTPTIRDGDHVAIDPHAMQLQDGRIYLFHILGDGHTIKRARRLADGQLWLISDNPNHPPMRPDEVEVRGRVVRRYPSPEDL